LTTLLSSVQIAERLGRSPATVKAYFYDPSDANKRPTDSPHANNAWPGCPAPRAGLGFLMLDRVAERRRAAQLARHYRDEDRLSIAEIARRLGRAEATIKAYLYDPTGDKARAVKARYRGVCRGCGAPTAPRNGKGDAYAYCKRCHPGAIAPQWTRERVREAMRAWRARYGAAPSSYDWSRTHACRRGGEALKRLQAAEWPAPSTVTDLYASWAPARADAFAGA
jgi:DNA-binding CsgD family transcriptional regulator